MRKFKKNIAKLGKRQCGIFFEVDPVTGRIGDATMIADDFESEIVVALALDRIGRALMDSPIVGGK